MPRLCCLLLLTAFVLSFAAGCNGTSPAPSPSGATPTSLQRFTSPPPPAGNLPPPSNKK